MIGMQIILDGDGAWPDLAESPDKVVPADVAAVAILDGGMASGAPSVAIRINLRDGRVVVAQTSAKLFLSAANAFAARYPELLK